MINFDGINFDNLDAIGFLAICNEIEKMNIPDKNNASYQRMMARLDKREAELARGSFRGGGSDGLTTAAAKAHSDAFMNWMRKGSNENELRSLEINAGLSTVSDPDGGFLTPASIDQSIERLAVDSVAMRRLATVKTSKGEYSKPISKGGASGGWVSEMDDRDETDSPELNLFAPKFAEIYANPKCTQKLLDLSDFDIEAWLTEEISDTFIETEGTGFIAGDGVGKVHGIIDESKMIENSSWEYGKTGYVVSGNASLIDDPEVLVDLQHALKPVYRQNGVWLMNDNTAAKLRKIKDGDGNFIWRGGLLEGAPDILLGKPVEIDDNMPNIGADAYPVAFGDWKRAYTILDHISGIRLLRDPYSKKGWVYFYTTKRVAAGISNYQALKFLKISE